MSLVYQGSSKHKLWTPGGAFGSICPDWTHKVAGRTWGAVEPSEWSEWPKTVAQALLKNSILYQGQRYAAKNGIAFCSQTSLSGTWHGYPIPWRDVPLDVQDLLIKDAQVSDREIRRGIKAQKGGDPLRDLKWALG